MELVYSEYLFRGGINYKLEKGDKLEGDPSPHPHCSSRGKTPSMLLRCSFLRVFIWLPLPPLPSYLNFKLYVLIYFPFFSLTCFFIFNSFVNLQFCLICKSDFLACQIFYIIDEISLDITFYLFLYYFKLLIYLSFGFLFI